MTTLSKSADAWNPWGTYIDARAEARRRRDRKVGTEHLILGLLWDPILARALECDLQTARDALTILELEPPEPAAELIAAFGVDRTAARQRLALGRAAA